MGKTITQLVDEILKNNQAQEVHEQVNSLPDRYRPLRKPGSPFSMIYVGLSKAFNTKPGSPRFSIRTLSPIRKKALPTIEEKNPQTYSWSPVTTMEAGLTIPYLYGTMKTKGNVIQGHLGGSNDIGSQQSVTALIAVSKGPIDSYVTATLNGKVLLATVGYEPTQWSVTKIAGFDFRYGWNTQQAPSNANDAYTSIPVDPGSQEINYGAPVLITYDMTGKQDAWVYLNFRSGLYSQPETGADVANEACHVVVELREGHVGGFTTVFDQDIICNRRAAYRVYIRVFIDQYGNYFVPLNDAEYDIRISKTTVDKNNNGAIETASIAGGGSGYNVGDHITVAGSGVNAILNVDSISGSAIASISIHAGGSGYSVGNEQATTTLTGGGSGATVNILTLVKAMNDLIIEYLTVGIRDDFSYNGIAFVELHGIATEELNGTLDFSVVVKGRQVAVYSDVNTYAVQWSDNPAWVCFDILTQPIWINDTYSWDGTKWTHSTFHLSRYDGIDPASIDIQSFIDWATHCDESVTPPDYDPTDVKRCTFNGIFDSASNIWDAAQSVAENARAWLLPPSGKTKYRVVLDKAYVDLGGPSVSQIFSTGNIIKDSLKQTYTSMVDRATELQVDFINKENDWESDTFNARYLSAAVSREDSLNLFGVTVPSQAWRRAMLQLYYNAVTPVEAEWDVGQDALNCEVGDVVGLQHEMPQWGYGGRVVSATGSLVELDRPVAIEADTDYVLAVRNSNDVLTEFSILYADNTPATGATYHLHGTFNPVPAQYDPFAFGEPSMMYKPFRVLEISNNGDNTFHIVGQEYNASVYNVDTDTPPIPTANYSSLVAFPPVTNIELKEIIIILQDGTVQDNIDVYFQRPASSLYAKAHIYYRTKKLAGDAYPTTWQYAGATVADTFRIESTLINFWYEIAVVTANTTGRRAAIDLSPSDEIYTEGKDYAPEDVTNFKVIQQGLTLIFTWTHVSDGDLWGYEIRVGNVFASSIEILDVQSANRYDYPAPVAGVYTFWIRAKDTTGNYSDNPASATITVVGVQGRLDYALLADLVREYDNTGQVVFDYNWVSAGYFFDWSPASGCGGSPPSYWADFTADPCLLATFESKNVQIGDNPIASTIQLTQETSIYNPDATDQTYPNRLDQDYPNDTDQHVTSDMTTHDYTSKIYYAFGDNVDPTNWVEYVHPITETLKYLKVRSITSAVDYNADEPFSLTSLKVMADLQDFEFDIPGFIISHIEGEDVFYADYGYTMNCNNPNIQASVSYGSESSTAVSLVPYISQVTDTSFHIELKDIVGTGRTGMVNIHVHGF
jgi:hypothetical protein